MVGALIVMPTNIDGSGWSKPEEPPASVGGGAQRGTEFVDGFERSIQDSRFDLWRVHPDLHAAVRQVGPGCRESFVERAVGLRYDVDTCRQPPPRWSGQCKQNGLSHASAASSVSHSAASAIAAASNGVHGGHNRVLTCPAMGAFAMTSTPG